MSDAANDMLMGGGVRGTFRKADPIGTMYKGTIAEIGDPVQQTDIDDKPKFYDDGKPMMQFRIVLATADRDDDNEDDDGSRAVYVKGEVLKAIRAAVKAAGAKRLDLGGTLAIKHYANGEPAKKGYSAPKLYQAQYAPPAPGAAANDMLDADQAPEPIMGGANGPLPPTHTPPASQPAAAPTGDLF